jgi:hypothetical protein
MKGRAGYHPRPKRVQFNNALPRLLDAYDHGRLVPFLGAGASVPLCPLWPEFVDNLERLAQRHNKSDINDSGSLQSEPRGLIQRAAVAVRRLKNSGSLPFAKAIKIALQPRTASRRSKHRRREPPVSAALASIWWPLVLTTNYDDWFYALWNRGVEGEIPAFSKMEVVGRGSLDCQRVLNSLRAPDNPLLWALHGFVASQGRISLDAEEFAIGNPQGLAEQVTVGHEEYRRQVHNSLVFRRSFTEVFRSRSLMFVGTGLSDPDFLDLFDEILELHGPNPYSHFALVKRGSTDPRLLTERFQIQCIEYETYADLPKLIRKFGVHVRGVRRRMAGWSFNMRLPIPNLPKSAILQPLHILRGSMPSPGDGECAPTPVIGSCTPCCWRLDQTVDFRHTFR